MVECYTTTAQERVQEIFGTEATTHKTTQKTLQFGAKLRQDNRDKILKQKRTMAQVTQSEQPVNPEVFTLLDFILTRPTSSTKDVTKALKQLRELLAIQSNWQSFAQIMKTPLIQFLLTQVLSETIKTDVKLEAIYTIQNLALVSASYQKEFE